MKAVVNASPLIFLSKLGKIEILNQLFDEVLTTNEVEEEVLEGLKYGRHDALLVKKMIELGNIRSIKPKIRLELENLDEGEKSVLELATEKKIETVILDDLTGIKIAKYLGLVVKSTPFLLLTAVRENKITREDFKYAIDKLVFEFDYRISPVIYNNLLKSAEIETEAKKTE